MKAILLAAGKGTRISKDIGETCKCLMDIGGISLIRNTVEMLLRHNVQIHIVTGYSHNLIYKELENFSITYHYNPFFDITNSIASLWFARNALTADSIIIGNADVYWEDIIFNKLEQEKKENIMIADSSRIDPVKGDYFFMHKNNRLISHGKNLEQAEITAEYVGLCKIQGAFVKKFVERLNYLVCHQKNNMWWEDVMYSYIGEEDIYVMDIKGLFWMEIDYIDDYYKILSYRGAK